MFVYRRTNTTNGKVYVGKTTRTVDERWVSMLYAVGRGSTNPIHNAIRKYGADAFITDILYEAKSVEELNAMETFFIILHQSFKPENGYNLTLGGDGAAPGELNPMFGKTHTDEVKAKLRALRTGTKQTDETKRKIGEASSGEKNPAFGKVYMNERAVEGRRKGGLSHIGKKHSVATRQKIGKSHEGKQFSKEHCLHISQAKLGRGLGRRNSPETIERMRAARSLYWLQRKRGVGLVNPTKQTSY